MSLPDGLLARVKRGRVFIETGTGAGGGIRAAFEAGFEEIHSIDSSYPALELNRMHDYYFHCGDSRTILPLVLNDTHEAATLFLDAHSKGDFSPLREELCAAFRFPHSLTILIDDMHRYRDGTYWPDQRFIIAYLEPKFKFELVPNIHHPDNILICSPKNP